MADDVAEIKLTQAMEDVKEIVASRPELTQEEWEIVEKAAPWFKAQLKVEVRSMLELEYLKKQDEFQTELKALNSQLITEKLEEMRKARDPLSKEELEKLLCQEYTEIPVKLLRDGKEFSFTIKELPHAVEDKFLKILKKHLIPILQDKENSGFILDGSTSMFDRINSLLDGSTQAFIMACDLVVLIMDPFSKDSTITPTWVSNNISSFRMSSMILAQFEANKYRDFLFSGFQTFQSLKNG